MKYFFLLLLVMFCGQTAFSQDINKIINAAEVGRIAQMLASDEMEGRKAFTPSIDKAARFLASEFNASGLGYFDGLASYHQKFTMLKPTLILSSGSVNQQKVASENIIAITTTAALQLDENSDFTEVVLDGADNLFSKASSLLGENKNYVVWVNKSHAKNFSRLNGFNRASFEPKASVIFVLTDEKAKTYSFMIKNEIVHSSLANVIGVLPGRSKKNEYVIFSAHYDHLGIGEPNAKGDSIFNGANDNAAGTTAMVMLAKYFSKLNNNQRTLIFVAFTAEEIGGFGSQYFSKNIDVGSTVAMFNIEMIGTESKWGKNSAYITGFEKSDFGKILQKKLVGTGFKFKPDPYPDQNLFYRSDNATLAAMGVPAHTISTSKMDSEPNYHQQSDEITTLDKNNMAEIIKAIAISSQSIISGEDTPLRVPVK